MLRSRLTNGKAMDNKLNWAFKNCLPKHCCLAPNQRTFFARVTGSDESDECGLALGFRRFESLF